ncbi:DNA mismatch repair protein MutT [bacterium]|nr:DNA mismatch repair protein MutT [bacterium]|tara:strand:+ start:144 stop:563 length:420 start_codon:yes stop_codon:yes gene_type:complete
MADLPKVAVATFIRRDGKILLGKRKGTRGAGKWGVPGGRLEMWEDLTEAATREVKEETGLDVTNLKLVTAAQEMFKNDIDERVHYVTIFFVADLAEGEAEVMEPDSCEEWEWFAWDDMPKPLLACYDDLFKSGFNPFNV